MDLAITILIKIFNLFISKTYLTGVKIRIVAHWAQLSLPTFKTYCQSYIGTYKEFFQIGVAVGSNKNIIYLTFALLAVGLTPKISAASLFVILGSNPPL